MLRRFFSQQPIESATVTIADNEAHHLIHVLRAQPGDEYELFDGLGSAYRAEVVRVERKLVVLTVISEQPSAGELPFKLTLAVALPRGDRGDWLVQKAVEVGVSRLVPWQTARSVSQPKKKTQQRLERAVIEASKQCRRNRLMQIADPIAFEDYLRSSPNDTAPRASFLTHFVDNGPTLTAAASSLPSEVGEVQLGVGPEGGFTDEEAAQAVQSGWQLVRLGRTVLRTETAAVAAAAHVAWIRES